MIFSPLAVIMSSIFLPPLVADSYFLHCQAESDLGRQYDELQSRLRAVTDQLDRVQTRQQEARGHQLLSSSTEDPVMQVGRARGHQLLSSCTWVPINQHALHYFITKLPKTFFLIPKIAVILNTASTPRPLLSDTEVECLCLCFPLDQGENPPVVRPLSTAC